MLYQQNINVIDNDLTYKKDNGLDCFRKRERFRCSRLHA